jgi:hypothetical protein
MKLKGKLSLFLAAVLILTVFMGGIAFGQTPFPGSEVQESIGKGVKYLGTMENADGGFAAKPGGKSSLTLTAWVVMALEAAGEDCQKNVDYLNNAEMTLESTNDHALLLLALTAGGKSSGTRAQELAEKIRSFQQEDGWFGRPEAGEEGMINSHIWSVLALASTGEPIPQKDKAREWLLNKQNEDGGFGWLEGLESDADDTGAAIQALILLGEDVKNSQAVKAALQFIKGNQQPDGGFSAGEWMGRESNISSDAWVLQALVAVGENPLGSAWSVNGKNVVTPMLSLQNQDGSFNWKEDIISTPVTVTSCGIMALAEKPFPVNLSYALPEDISNSGRLFSDLAESHWAYQSIEELVEKGILSGYPDGTFRPENQVTRAEFTKFLAGVLASEEVDGSGGRCFPDVAENHWANNYIAAAVKAGLIQGTPDGNFGPNRQITGGELAAILVRALPAAKTAELTEGEKWYSGYVRLAEEEGLLSADFQPGAAATRAQCAFSLSKLINLLRENEGR